MPSITRTTPRALQAAIRDVLLAITPYEEQWRGLGWSWSEDNLEVAASMDARFFFFEWVPGSRVVGGLWGQRDYEADATLIVVTSYRAFPERDLGWLISQDHDDVIEAVSSALDPTVAGLTWAESAGFATRDAEAQTFEHAIALKYLTSRST